MLRYRKIIWKLRSGSLIALFFAALWLPLVGMYLGQDKQGTDDRRTLAEWPEFHFNKRSLKEFPHRFELYFNDHFGYRGQLIKWSNQARVHALKASPSPNVLIGEEGWLYYVYPNVFLAKPGPFSTAQLEAIREALELRQQWLARRGCRYLFFVAPDKQTIYPEYLPHRAIPNVGVSRLDQLVSHLRAHSTVPMLDVRDALREAKKAEQVYYRTDTHWNPRGALLASQMLARRLGEWFPDIQPVSRSAYQETTGQWPGDLGLMLGKDIVPLEDAPLLTPLTPSRVGIVTPLPALVHPQNPQWVPFAAEQSATHLPRAVLFHDSFSVSLWPFVAESFQRVACYWDDHFHPDVIEREKPQVVIHEMVERKLELLVAEEFQAEAEVLKGLLKASETDRRPGSAPPPPAVAP